jgi:hypothetical protein
MTPDPEGTAMTLTIDDTTIASNQTGTWPSKRAHQHEWELPWLPCHAMDRNTATILADTAVQGDLHEGHRLWPDIQGWAEEVMRSRMTVQFADGIPHTRRSVRRQGKAARLFAADGNSGPGS